MVIDVQYQQSSTTTLGGALRTVEGWDSEVRTHVLPPYSLMAARC